MKTTKIKTKKLVKWLFGLIFLTPNLLFAQEKTGIVMDEVTQKPLSGVHIFLKNTEQGITTNENGRYDLTFIEKIDKQDTLYLTYVGYQTKKMTLEELKKTNYKVFLTEETKNIEEVKVLTARELKPYIPFKKLAKMNKRLSSFGATLVGDKIYVVGGDESSTINKREEYFADHADLETALYNNSNFSFFSYNGDLQIYDIEQDTWQVSKSRFMERAYHNIHYFNDTLFVLGGKKMSTNRKFEYLDDKIEVYDIKTNRMTIDNVNPHQAANFASVQTGDKIIVMGGSIKQNKDGKKEYTDKIHLFDLGSGYWYELGNMPQAKEAKGVLLNNKIYLVGGYANKKLKYIETYDLNTGNWNAEAELFVAMERPALAHDGRNIFIFENGKFYVYNTSTKKITEYLINLYLKSAELFHYQNKLYLLGGNNRESFSSIPSSRLYCIDLNDLEKTRINQSKTFNNNIISSTK